MFWNGYWEEDTYFDIIPTPTFPVDWGAVSDKPVDPYEEILSWDNVQKDKYTAEELRSTMESIKTRLIILCEMRGL